MKWIAACKLSSPKNIWEEGRRKRKTKINVVDAFHVSGTSLVLKNLKIRRSSSQSCASYWFERQRQNQRLTQERIVHGHRTDERSSMSIWSQNGGRPRLRWWWAPWRNFCCSHSRSKKNGRTNWIHQEKVRTTRIRKKPIMMDDLLAIYKKDSYI